jgi:4-hydroxy-tetrahydrodipicolinate reductase
MYKIGVHGATGRVGKKICEFLQQDKDSVLSYAYSRSDDLALLFELSDIVIDFSVRAALDNLLNQALIAKKPLVIGTTGFSDLQKEALNKASKEIPILYSPNMTLGINIISLFLKEYGVSLKEYDVDLIETHHRNKKDAPSGTALMLGKNISENITNKEFDNYHSLRSGDGGFSEHEIIFAHGPERLRIHHQIMNSDIFAKNSIMAAKWMLKNEKGTGLYSMRDIYI